MAYSNTLGRGRIIRQRMFGHARLYGTPRPSYVAPGIVVSYFWSAAFTGSRSLAITTNTPGPVQSPAVVQTLAGSPQNSYFYLPCIPGQRYTASAYVRQTGGDSAVRISITGGILNKNPSFTTAAGITDWAGTNATISWQQTPSRAMFGAMLIAPTGGFATVDAHSVALSSVWQSDAYTASAWVYSTNGWSDVRAGINWYDSTGTLITQSVATSATAVPAGAWTQVTYTAVANYQAASAQLRIRMAGTPTVTDTLLVNDARLVPTEGVLNGGSFTDAYYTWRRPSITFTATAAQHTLTIGTPAYVNSNPTFENGIHGWTPAVCSITQSSTVSHSGTYSMLVVPDGTAGVNAVVGELVKIPAGATSWIVSLWVYSPNGYSDFRASVAFYDSSGVLITNVNPTAATAASAGTWTNLVLNTSAPLPIRTGNVVYAAIRVRQGGTPATTDVYYVDDAYMTFSASNAGSTIFVDALQHEVGDSVSTWSSTGPSIYGVFGGFVERWPSNWNFQGTYGLAQVTGVDAFAVMANRVLNTELVNQFKTTQPSYYWRLNEQSTATAFADSSGNQGPNLVRMDSKAGPATTFAPGTATNILGDPSGTGIQFAETPPAGTCIQTGWSGTPSITWGGSVGTWDATFAIVVNLTNANGLLLRLASPSGNSNLASVYHRLDMATTAGGQLTLASFNAATAFFQSVTASVSGLVTGGPTLIVGHVGMANGTFYQDLFAYNGTNAAQASNSVASAVLNFVATRIEVAGRYDSGITGDNPYVSTYSHVVLWNGLSINATTNTGLTTLGNLETAFVGWRGQSTSTNITRYLNYNFIGRTAIESGVAGSTGVIYQPTTQGVSTLQDETAQLDACQAVSLSENGNFYVDPNGGGIPTFQTRYHRYAETTAKWVFGENAAAGEIPYLGDIAFDYDPTQVYNDIKVSRSGGINAIGGTTSEIGASQLKYGQRSYSRTVNVSSDGIAQDAANWIFGGHKNPHQRLQQLTINPAANPSLWPAALGIRISDRVTVRRRTSAGLTMSADFFIERIEHSRGPGEWLVTYQMSPFAATAQPAFLDSPTYGRFDTGGSVLALAATATSTSLTVRQTASDTWTTTASDFSFPVTVDSEQMTLTGISNIVSDTFNRTVANGFGSADTLQAWTVIGTAAAYSVGSGIGQFSMSVVGTEYVALLDTSVTDFAYTVDVNIAPATAGTTNVRYRVGGRGTDQNNFYYAQLDLDSTGTVRLGLLRRLAGTDVTIAANVVVGTNTAGDWYRVTFAIAGATITATAYDVTHPTAVQTVTATDNALTSGSLLVLAGLLVTGYTGATPVVVGWRLLATSNPLTFAVTRSNGAIHAIGAPVNVTNAFRLAY